MRLPLFDDGDEDLPEEERHDREVVADEPPRRQRDEEAEERRRDDDDGQDRQRVGQCRPNLAEASIA